jgi:glycosyltransferase involved in cell wall biosynthesis
MRRVLYLLRYHPTLTETFVYREIRALEARGWEIDVATLGGRPDGALQEILPRGRIRIPPRVPLYLPLLRDLLPFALDAGVWRALAWLRLHLPMKGALKALWIATRCREYPRVHVHFCGEAAEWACASRLAGGPPYTVCVHAVDLFKPRPSLLDVLRRAETVFTISRYNVDRLRERYGIEARLLRCGVELPPAPARRHSEGPLVVLAVGRWVPKKGLDTLIQAISLCEEQVRLVLVSDAPEGIENDRVHATGLLPPSRVAELLGRADLFALPCRCAPDGDMDGIPVAMMEALAHGVPVLGTSLGALPELLDEEVGWSVEPDDPRALAATLDAIARDPEERWKRGARGPERLRSRGFLLDVQAGGLLEAWGEET